MKILHASNVDLAVPEGSVEHVLGLAHGLHELGHEAVVLAPASGPPAKEGRFKLRVVESPGTAWARARAVARSIRRIAEEEAPDAVYLRSFPLDYLFVVRRLRSLDVPVIAELNTMARAQHRALGYRLRAPVFAWFESRTLRAVDGWAPLTNEIADYASRLSGVRDKPHRLALNAFDVADIPEHDLRRAIRAEHGVEPTDTVLVMAGFGHPWHGVDRALKAMAHLDGSHHLWLVGARRAADRALVDDHASTSMRSRIKVFESMPYDDLIQLFTACDVGLGSLAFDRHGLSEAQPLKVALYLALGLPVVINYRDVRFSESSPFVARMATDTPAAVVEALERLKPITPSLRQQASQFAAHHLSWREAARHTVALVEDLRVEKPTTPAVSSAEQW